MGEDDSCSGYAEPGVSTGVSGLLALPFWPYRIDDEDEEAIMAVSTNEVLASAARSALRAPSVFNTQLWRWVLEGDVHPWT